jgi:hypothetical protein
MYDKTLACYFCEKLFKHRIQKHIKNVHGNEMMVAEAVTKISKTERENKMKKIKNLGSFKYNINVIKAGHGNVIVARRPTKKTLEAKHFLPCIHCYGFFISKFLFELNNSQIFFFHEKEYKKMACTPAPFSIHVCINVCVCFSL